MIAYYILAMVAYIVGGTITYKKQHCPARQEAVHYQGSRPDTLIMNNPYYKPKTKTNEKNDTTTLYPGSQGMENDERK